MEKLINDTIKNQLPLVAYWQNADGNFYSSVEHCNYINSLNIPTVTISTDTIALIRDIEDPEPTPPPIPDSNSSTIYDYDTALENASYSAFYGEKVWRNPDINRWVSEQLIFEGSGVNSNNVTGWTKRFNGMTCNNISAPMTEFGILIHNIEVTSDDSTKAGRKLSVYHYNVDGGDSTWVYDIPLDKFDNQFGCANNIKLFIPGGRRIAFWLAAGPNDARFVYPQLRISYRKVLSND